jgi:hypothetical protein
MSGMLKAGLIGFLVGGLFSLGATLVLPCCTPCAAIPIGLGAGFLACLWDRPARAESGAGLGAESGGVAGIGSLLGQVVGMIVNGLLVGPQMAAEFSANLGLPATQLDSSMYWGALIIANGVCGLTNVAIAAALGALGGLLWHQTIGKNQASGRDAPA